VTTRRVILLCAGVIGVLLLFAAAQLPTLGAGGLLHPYRRPLTAATPSGCEDAVFNGVGGVTLQGWRCQGIPPGRGTLVYLHGIADNRGSAVGVIERFRRRGFDVVAYDSRAHGASAGEACTYGFYEKDDLQAAIDAVDPSPVVLFGTSLGAAVALQHAPRDRRVKAIIAVEAFSDLRTVARERAPFIFTAAAIDRAFAIAERQARFDVDAVSPLNAARAISVPVLLIHGADDVETSPTHSHRIFAALSGPKKLISVPGAGHNQSLATSTWPEIDRWIDEYLPASPLR
jgi:pimeloyl-ACP methyl ester carboxylesterase